MPSSLIRHPDSRCSEVQSITVNAVRTGKPGVLQVSYVVEGTIGGIALPERLSPERADELWRHTCFEIFLKPPGGEGYIELNFSPSTRWAAYRFREQRRGMQNVDIAAPVVDIRVGERIEVVATVDLSGAPELPADQPWKANITTIIEQTNGWMSYWALKHAPDKADFHHPDGFVLNLAVPQKT